MRKIFARRSIGGLLLGTLALTLSVARADNAVPWNAGQQGSHVLSLGVGGADDLWVGMQDWALWNLQSAPGGATRWRQFTVKDGLGDNDAYAVAADKKGRIWVGHLNHGVSVWNGATWRNYGVTDGPIGERVFDIAVCPTDGDVWVATNRGLARYSDERDSWTNYSRADGLTCDQINAIAFDGDGDIYCGTQTDGLNIARAAENYENWTSVRANTIMPDRAAGAGLPSNLVNDVLVARGRPNDGVGANVIYAATVYGLAWSRDKGASWRYVRGQDWEANVKGRIIQPKSIEVETVDDELLQQDWTTSLSEDRFGLLWVGHLRKGYEVRDPQTLRTTYVSSDTPLAEGDEDYVRAILDAPGYGSIVARYGGVLGGISSLGKGLASSTPLLFGPGESDKFAELPAPAAPPNIAQLDEMRARLAKINRPLEPGEGVYLGEDWQTQGDWVGRYGRGHATLSGMEGGSGEDYQRLAQEGNDHVLNALPGYNVSVAPGPRNTYGMVSWINSTRTQNPRSLFSPLLGYRRQSEWNDYGNELEVSPWSSEGPDLWVTVKVPDGVHRASLYFFNKDGQAGQNRYRDFPIELKNTLPDQKQMNAAPAIARARVSDFWGGVYQQFALCGPANFSFKIRRNHSYAVIMQGVFLDPLAQPDAQTETKPLSWMNGVAYGAPAVSEAEIAGSKDVETVRAARALWRELDRVAWDKSGSGVQWPMRLQALRAAQAAGAPASLLTNWRWQLAIWNDADRATWNETMAKAFPAP